MRIVIGLMIAVAAFIYYSMINSVGAQVVIIPLYCETPIMTETGARYGPYPVFMLADMGEESAQFFTDFYNNTPPLDATVEADQVVVFDHELAQHVWVIMYKDGCKVGSVRVDAKSFNEMMEYLGEKERKQIIPAVMEGRAI